MKVNVLDWFGAIESVEAKATLFVPQVKLSCAFWEPKLYKLPGVQVLGESDRKLTTSVGDKALPLHNLSHVLFSHGIPL